MKALFVCSMNRLRSPTAEYVAKEFGIESDSAGTDKNADTPLSEEQIIWADKIFVMEKNHKNRIDKKFSHLLKDKRIIVLGIPDEYEYMDPELIKILKNKLSNLLQIEPESKYIKNSKIF